MQIHRHSMSFAFVLLVAVGLIGSGTVFSSYSTTVVGNQLGGVGTFATVEPNPYNTLMKQIRDKEADVQEREMALAAREKLPPVNNNSDMVKSTYAFLAVLFGLLFLLHVYLDKKYPLGLSEPQTP